MKVPDFKSLNLRRAQVIQIVLKDGRIVCLMFFSLFQEQIIGYGIFDESDDLRQIPIHDIAEIRKRPFTSTG
jgi:hypothetical protein